MEGRFIVYEKFQEGNLTGIQQKMLTQIRVFNQYGLTCEKKYLPRGDEECGTFLGALLSLLPWVNKFPVWQQEEELGKMDFLYFRRPIAMSRPMRKFLKRVRKINPSIKIVMEIPTYPYDGELQTPTLFPFLLKDRHNRKKMAGLLDALAVISGGGLEERIWGIPAIPMQNGYDVQGVEPVGKREEHGCINLCCIAMFQPWHGYERLLLGMQRYYEKGGDREFVCHFIGEGTELNLYKKLAKNKHLEHRVVFYGKQSGQRLAKLYHKMDIGVCSLGSYKRKDLGGVLSELKSREYMAKGLPVIVGSKIDVFQKNCPDFVCEFENNENLLDMERIVLFYDSWQSKEDWAKKIRQFALEHVDMSITMRPVIEFLKGGKD